MTPQIISLIIIALVLIIDFYYNGTNKKDVLEKKRLEGTESLKKLDLSHYFSTRKKNFALSIISILILKVCFNYFFYPNIDPLWLSFDFDAVDPSSFGGHINDIFSEKLWLFIPSALLILFIDWYFNDKIKAR